MRKKPYKSRYRNLEIFTGNAHPKLAEEICQQLNIPLSQARVDCFSDGESRVVIRENVRGSDVYVIQPSVNPVNHHIMEMLVMIEALKRSSAERITAVMPYHGYARQDRKVLSGAPISARMIADLSIAAGANRILTMDLHAGQIQGMYGIPVDNLYASPVLIPFIQKTFNGDIVILSPDSGGTDRAEAYAKRLECGWAVIDKRRDKTNGKIVSMKIIGDVIGKHVIVLDDMIDTGGTLTLAAEAIMEAGARKVSACATHGIFSGQAIERIAESCIERIVTTDTLPPQEKNFPKLTRLPVSDLFAKAIFNIHTDQKVSELFEIPF